MTGSGHVAVTLGLEALKRIWRHLLVSHAHHHGGPYCMRLLCLWKFSIWDMIRQAASAAVRPMSWRYEFSCGTKWPSVTRFNSRSCFLHHRHCCRRCEGRLFSNHWDARHTHVRVGQFSNEWYYVGWPAIDSAGRRNRRDVGGRNPPGKGPH